MMKLDRWNPDDVTALARFYGAGDEWSWETILGKDGTDKEREIAGWIEGLAPPRTNPILLPIVKPGTKFCTWFAIAFSARQCEELRELLQSFVGQAGSTFSGYRPGGLTAGDPVSQIVRDWCGGNFFFEFRPLDNSVADVRAALSRLNQLLLKRPTRERMTLRTTEALLSEYHSALLRGDEFGARKWIAELKESGRISAQNSLFLHFDCLAAFGRWQEMTEDPQWQRAVHLHRPRRITFGMIRALWHRHFADSFDGLVGNSLDIMRLVLAEHRPLFKSALGSRDPEVLTMFTLAAAADLPPRYAQLAKTLGAFPDSEDAGKLRDFAEDVARTIAPPTTPEFVVASDPLANVRDAMDRFDPETAWGILTGDLDSLVKDSSDWFYLLLHCAREIESVETASLVNSILSSRGGVDAVLRTRTHRDHWAKLQQILEREEGPGDWNSWLEYRGDPRKAFERLTDAVEQWNVADYQNNPERVRRIAEAIQNTPEPGTVKMAAPYLVEFFIPDGTGRSEFQEIYLNLITLIVLGNCDPADGDWGIVEVVAKGIFYSDPPRGRYRETLEALTVFWEERGQYPHLDWALDMVDALISGPDLDHGAINVFFQSVLADFHKFARRIDSAQRNLFRLLCEDLGKSEEFCAIQFPEQESTESGEPAKSTTDLSRKRIAIYTLDESPARRAKTMLEAEFPGIDVNLNHDHGGSEKLEALARNADHFVVVTWSAKHAATDFIRARRSDLIYPPGRSAASIVRTLLAHAASA